MQPITVNASRAPNIREKENLGFEWRETACRENCVASLIQNMNNFYILII